MFNLIHIFIHLDIEAVMCIKPANVDGAISRTIRNTGIWEENEVVKVMKMMELFPNAVFFDIGSNIGFVLLQLLYYLMDYIEGMYTVMVAAMSRRVVAVDPMKENIDLIHRSLQRAKKRGLVSLINNAVSDKKTVYYPVLPTNRSWNPGATKLFEEKDLTSDLRKSISGDPMESVTLRQLINFSKAKEVIIKMDVEVVFKNNFILIFLN